MTANSNTGSKKTVLIIIISVLAAAAVIAALIFTGVIQTPLFGGETQPSESGTLPSQTQTAPADPSADPETDVDESASDESVPDGETVQPLFVPDAITFEPGTRGGYEAVSYQLRWQEDRVSLYCAEGDGSAPAGPYAEIYFDAETGDLTKGEAFGRYEPHDIPDDIFFTYETDDASGARALSSAKIHSEDEIRKVCDRFATFSGAGKISEITVAGITSGFTFSIGAYEGETPLSGFFDGTTAGYKFVYAPEENGAAIGRFGKLTVGDANGYYVYEYDAAGQLIAFHDDDDYKFTADGRLAGAEETVETTPRFADMTFSYNGDGLLTVVSCADNFRYPAASVSYTDASPAQVRAYRAIASLGYNMVTGTQYCPLAPEDLYRGERTGDVALSLLLPVNGDVCVW